MADKILDDVIRKFLHIPKAHMLKSTTDLKSHNPKKTITDFLILPEFDQIGQKRFKTVHNVSKTQPLQFLMTTPLRKVIRKRNFDGPPWIEINNVVLKSMTMVLGGIKLKSKEVIYSIIDGEGLHNDRFKNRQGKRRKEL
ncbi:unnamed protein product [Arctia plantaginis]|uniref:Uncharacterized protein n=1 Tax=Arctia plantaginis TaxID=874455 RepID=A0A8S1AXF6_ARCPL|nr:unnamed protein product [Arctia plantaginis]